MAIWWYLIPIAKFFSRELIGRIRRPPGNPAPLPPYLRLHNPFVVQPTLRKSLKLNASQLRAMVIMSNRPSGCRY